MKSLSILILLGSVTAFVVGGFFAVSTVFAEPVAPLTGESVLDEPVVIEAPTSGIETNPGITLASTFTINIEKDVESSTVVQETTELANFIGTMSSGKGSQVMGIFVQDVMAYSVTAQNGNAAFVSPTPEVVTQFELAAEYGSTAFLAHNYLAGASFFELSQGQIITLVYGDGSTDDFQIQSIRRFQALSPDSTQSSFRDLESDEQFSASNLFYLMYNSDNSVVLQTCIANEGISTWGRLFVIAVPLS
jgi:hypothetical protein